MQARIYPINECPLGLLAIMARPRAGDWLEDEITSWRQQGIQTVVCLLEDDEITELGLDGEAKTCEQAGLRFIRFPVPDRGVPDSTSSLSTLVSTLAGEIRGNRGIGIHCRMGVGRSAVVAVCVLVALGTSIESAWDVVAKARGVSVPDTPEQRAHVSDWARQWFKSMTK